MKKLEKKMSFNEVEELLKQNPKYRLTKDKKANINMYCKHICENQFIHPEKGVLSSLIKTDIYVEYSDLYTDQMMRHIILLGNELNIKLDRPALKDIENKYIELGLDKEPMQQWTRHYYLEANTDANIKEYEKSEKKTFYYVNNVWVEKRDGEQYEKNIDRVVVTKNKVMLMMIELGLSPERMDLMKEFTRHI